jgi:EmrB/QacA subfamily drug resistance transporter
MAARRAMVERPATERVEPQAWLALVLASSTSMVVGLAVTAVNVAFPAIEHEFAGTSRSTLSWGLTGYSIALASLMLIGGRLADHLGRRRIFRVGVAVFIVASVAIALAPAAWVFVAARLGQAVGAALSGPASLTLVIERFPASRRLSAIATWIGLGTLGSAIGPSFAAIVTQQLGWRWIFVLPLVASVAGFLLATRWLPEGLPSEPRAGGIDVLGSVMGTAGVGMLAATITDGPRLGWTHPAILVCAGGAAALIPMFVRRSRRHPEPLLDVRLFSFPNVKAVNVVNIGLTAAGTSSWLLYPLFMVQHWHYSLLRTGFALTPFPIVASTIGIWAGRLAERLGTRRVIAYGALLPAFGMLWQVFRLDSTPNYFLGLAPGAVLFNIGFGIVYAPVTALALRSIGESQLGQATAAFNSLRQLGGGLGIAMVIAIMGNAAVIPIGSFRHALIAIAGIAFAGGLVVLTTLRVPIEFRPVRRTSHARRRDGADCGVWGSRCMSWWLLRNRRTRR